MKKNILVYVSLLLNILLIGFGLTAYFIMSKQVELVAGLLESSGNTVIEQNIPIEETISVTSDFIVLNSIPVGVQMHVNQMIDIIDTLYVKQSVQVPITMKINQIIEMDTVFQITKPVSITINDTIPLSQNITITIGNIPFSMPVETKIPIHQELMVTMDQIPISGSIPVRFELTDTIDVHLNFPFPVNMQVPVSLNINNPALISFFTSLPVSGDIPLKMKVPVSIPLYKTQLKEKLDSVALILRGF